MGGPWLLISSLKLEMSAAQEQLSLIIPRNKRITVVCKLFGSILVKKSVAKSDLQAQQGFLIHALSIARLRKLGF